MQSYLDLISDLNLPQKGYFTDPHDNTTIHPLPNENLTQFMMRVNKRRLDLKISTIEIKYLREIVVEMFYLTTPDKQRPQYFKTKTVMPTLANVFSLAKAVASEFTATESISIKQRRERAVNFCLNKCPFHKASGSISSSLSKLIDKTIDAVIRDEEAELNQPPQTNLKSPSKALAQQPTSSPQSFALKQLSFVEERALGLCMGCGGCNLKSKVKLSTKSILASLLPEQIVNMIRTFGGTPQSFDKCFIFKEAINNPRLTHTLRGKIEAGGGKYLPIYDEYVSNPPAEPLLTKVNEKSSTSNTNTITLKM